MAFPNKYSFEMHVQTKLSGARGEVEMLAHSLGIAICRARGFSYKNWLICLSG